MQRRIIAACVIAGVALYARDAAAQMTPLFVIPTETATTESIASNAFARVRLTVTDASGLADKLGTVAPAGAGTLDYVIGPYPQLKSSVDRTWLEATFLVDYDQPVFAKLKEEVDALDGKHDRAQIVGFVDRIVDENTPRGWDFASTVARRRQGDCTEHAVLTAAIARMYGIPARVIVGIALLDENHRFATFGHAWAETLENGKWIVADAALNGATQTVRYVPTGIVEDEGMGYVMSLAGMTDNMIQKVEVLGPAR